MVSFRLAEARSSFTGSSSCLLSASVSASAGFDDGEYALGSSKVGWRVKGGLRLVEASSSASSSVSDVFRAGGGVGSESTRLGEVCDVGRLFFADMREDFLCLIVATVAGVDLVRLSFLCGMGPVDDAARVVRVLNK